MYETRQGRTNTQLDITWDCQAVFIACESTVGRNGAEMAAQVMEMKEVKACILTPPGLPSAPSAKCGQDGAEFSDIIRTACPSPTSAGDFLQGSWFVYLSSRPGVWTLRTSPQALACL